jgi:hypothetical protein
LWLPASRAAAPPGGVKVHVLGSLQPLHRRACLQRRLETPVERTRDVHRAAHHLLIDPPVARGRRIHSVVRRVVERDRRARPRERCDRRHDPLVAAVIALVAHHQVHDVRTAVAEETVLRIEQ